MCKYIFITGGVLSSLGKGITASSLSSLLELRNYKVKIKKFDPYLNYASGTMSPLQHGEVFVTEDGGEGDLDLGHYERFLNSKTDKSSDITSGKIFYNVLEKERKGDYEGGTVQVIPHITDEIKLNICSDNEGYDIVVVEIGGTAGDIEGLPFLEAIRQMKLDNSDDILYVHVTLIPYIKSALELKTKPTQHSVRRLQEIGISPDILVCRSEYPLDTEIRKKLSQFCNVDENAVISCIDLNTIYQVPLVLNEERMDSVVLEKLNLPDTEVDLSIWQDIVRRIKQPKDIVKIGIVGKYLDTKDAYISLKEALLHGGLPNELKVEIKWIDAEALEKSEHVTDFFTDLDGILVPGGFGERGVEGKILAAKFARITDIPFLGIGLGMSAAVVEYSRNVLKIKNATLAESDDIVGKELVVDYQHDECYDLELGATMRLGGYKTGIIDNTLAKLIYEDDIVLERHRHRLEVNNVYKEQLEQNGMIVSGKSIDSDLIDIMEIKSHRWFVVTQFHPEFNSKPFAPHKIFTSYVKACHEYKLSKQTDDVS